nr:hypothetical protein [Candidatus Sigynarchaeum springense]
MDKHVAQKPTRPDDVVLPLRLFRDFQVIMADHEIKEGRTEAAIIRLKMAAQACFDIDENARCNSLLDRADAAQIDPSNGPGRGIAGQFGKKGILSKYIEVLRNDASDAVIKGNLNRARDLLRQLVVLGKNLEDKRVIKDYKNQIRSIWMVYSVKGIRSVTLQRVFTSRLVHALKEAMLRRELAFRISFALQKNVLQPILAQPILLPLSNDS